MTMLVPPEHLVRESRPAKSRGSSKWLAYAPARANDHHKTMTDAGREVPRRCRARARSGVGDGGAIAVVWKRLPDNSRARCHATRTASKPDTEFHRVRHGVSRSRYNGALRKPMQKPHKARREAIIKSTPCNSV